MDNKAKFAAFLLKKYKGAALFIAGAGIVFAVFIFFVILDLFFRPSTLNLASYYAINGTLFIAGLMMIAGLSLWWISRIRKKTQLT